MYCLVTTLNYNVKEIFSKTLMFTEIMTVLR